jgi:hypothetical protein
MTPRDAYIKGFVDKCAQLGVAQEGEVIPNAVVPEVKINKDEPLIQQLWDDEDTAKARYPELYQKIVQRKKLGGPTYKPPIQNQY